MSSIARLRRADHAKLDTACPFLRCSRADAGALIEAREKLGSAIEKRKECGSHTDLPGGSRARVWLKPSALECKLDRPRDPPHLEMNIGVAMAVMWSRARRHPGRAGQDLGEIAALRHDLTDEPGRQITSRGHRRARHSRSAILGCTKWTL